MLPKGGERPPEILSTLDKTQPQAGLAPRFLIRQSKLYLTSTLPKKKQKNKTKPKKHPVFTGNILQTLKEERTILYNLFHRKRESS